MRWETTWSLVTSAQCGAFDEFRVCAGSPYIDDSRNHLARWFLNETDYDKFLSLDSDISFVPQDLAQLAADLDDGLECVSGCYYNVFEGVLKPVVKFLDARLTPAQSDDPIMEVDKVGAGFVMVTREVLEKMAATYDEPSPWFYEPVVDGEHLGEDFGFCHRVHEIGAKVHIDLRVQLSHYKTVRLTGPNVPPLPNAGGGSFGPMKGGHLVDG